MIAPRGRFVKVSRRAFSFAALSSNFGASDSLDLICSAVSAGATGPDTCAMTGHATSVKPKGRLKMRFIRRIVALTIAGRNPCLGSVCLRADDENKDCI